MPEQIVLIAGRLNDKEQASLAAALQRYTAQLQKSQQTEQASRLQAAVASLKQEKYKGSLPAWALVERQNLQLIFSSLKYRPFRKSVKNSSVIG